MLEMLNLIRLRITDVLNIVLFQNNYIFLNIWSFVHLLFGILIMLFLIKLKFKLKFLLLFFILLIYEIIEFILTKTIPGLFIPELFIDFVWDIIIGLAGGLIMWLYLKIKK